MWRKNHGGQRTERVKEVEDGIRKGKDTLWEFQRELTPSSLGIVAEVRARERTDVRQPQLIYFSGVPIQILQSWGSRISERLGHICLEQQVPGSTLDQLDHLLRVIPRLSFPAFTVLLHCPGPIMGIKILQKCIRTLKYIYTSITKF